MDSGTRVLFDQDISATNPLPGGTAADGDGAVLQLGYYSNATTSNNFSGTWVPLSGETSPNTAMLADSSPAEPYNRTSIGDLTANGAGDGTFALSFVFVEGSATSGNNLPPMSGVPLALRFYNNTTIASSTFFNVVSDDLWRWGGPGTPPPAVPISLDDPGLEWLSVALGQPQETAFHTTIAVPEPGTFVLTLIGATLVIRLGCVRRRPR